MPAEILRAERRRTQRQAVSRLVTIEPSPNVPGHEGLVTNMSKGGARLFVQNLALPETFAIVFADTHERRECKTIWRIGPEMGVEFLAGPPKARTRKLAARTPVKAVRTLAKVGARTTSKADTKSGSKAKRNR
jgi:hypothetical protein